MSTTVNSSTTAQLLVAADGSRTSLTIQNTDANELFIGLDNTVTTTSYAYRRVYGTGYTFDGVDAQQAYYGIWDVDGSGGAVITEITTPASDSNGAFSTYGDLKDEIAAWIRPNSAVSSDMTARIPVYVGLAEVQIRRDLHGAVSDETDAALTITTGAATVPTGLQAVVSMTMVDEPYNEIRYLPIDQLDKLDPQQTSDKPYYWSRSGTSFRFYPLTSGTAKIRYRRGMTPLANDSDTNWVLQSHPDLYLFASLVQAGRRLIDPRTSVWEQAYGMALQAARGIEMDLPTSALYPQPSGYVV